MIEKKVVFGKAEVMDNGIVQIRLEKQLIEGGVLLSAQYHRTVVEPGTPVDVQMAAVNAHLALMGYPAADADAVERVKRIVDVEHTPERVAKFRADREARERGNAPR